MRTQKRAQVTLTIGKPFGPFNSSGASRPGRDELDQIGESIMRHIADQLPQEKRGCYSEDPAIRAAARGTEIYPWANEAEG